MTLFVLVFLSIYTGMHLLVFWGMHPLLARHPAVPTLAWLWMVPMVLAPLAVRLLDRSGYEAPARGLAWVAYSWLGFLFIAFSFFAVIGVLELLLWGLPKLITSLPRWSVDGPQSAALESGADEARQWPLSRKKLQSLLLGN